MKDPASASVVFPDTKARFEPADYVRIARPGHWFKNLFMLPGTATALALTDVSLTQALWPTLLALISTCFIASAYYVINEWLDREFDSHHPIKKQRPSVAGTVRGSYVLIEYVLLSALGLAIALSLSNEFFIFTVALLVSGIVYNVRPLRTKDRVYLDVLTESLNNPLRFLLGWSAVVSGALPPSSVLLAYWMGGAFLMAVKRFAEYRFIGDPNLAGLYRRSFRYYTEEKLLLSSFFYGICSAFFGAIFLIKYRVEFLLSFPLFAFLFTWYLAIGMKPHSRAQGLEKLYREGKFIAFVLALSLIVALLFFVDISWLEVLTRPLDY